MKTIKTKQEKFKEGFAKTDLTWGEALDLLNTLTLEEMKGLYQALCIINQWCDLDMRNKAIMGSLQIRIEIRESE